MKKLIGLFLVLTLFLIAGCTQGQVVDVRGSYIAKVTPDTGIISVSIDTLEDSAEFTRLETLHPDWPREKIRDQAAVSYQDWVLLLQVPSVWNPPGIDWLYDMASVYFLIRREDLLARRFSQVWLGYQDH